MPIIITTNNVPRFTIDGFELTEKERADFDYLNWAGIDEGTDSATFFRYRGELYDLGNFMRTSGDGDMKGWDGYHAESFSSGMLVKLHDDESVIVGRYYVKG